MSTPENKKNLAKQLKTKLNSLDYVSMSDLIKYGDSYGDMLAWIHGNDIHKKENWITGTNINPNPNNRKNSEHAVCYEELEPDDWEEIVSLIKKKNKEKEQIWEEKKRNIENKLNSQPNLYYYWGQSLNKGRADSWTEKGQGYSTFLGRENAQGYHLYVSENHPVLDSFPFQIGFYLIDTYKPIKKQIGPYNGYTSTGGKINPFNFTKYAEVGDYVEIFQYDNGDSRLDNNTIKELIAYFQKNNFRQITLLSDGNLQIEYNPHVQGQISQPVVETITSEQLMNNQLLQIIQANHKNSISVEKLNSLLNTNSMPTDSSNNKSNNKKILELSMVVGGIIVIGIVVIGLIRKKINKNKI